MESRKIILQTKKFSVVRVETKTSDEQTVRREIVEHAGAVTIVPFVDDDSVCLIRNRRVAAQATLIELPAGTLEPGEAPLETAQRELQEETGYGADRWQPLPWFFMSPGILTEKMHLFIARGLTAGSPRRERDEEIENLVVPWREALDMVDHGTIQDAKTMVGLLRVDRLRRLGEW